MSNESLVLHALPETKFALPVLDWMSRKAVLSSYDAVSPVTAAKFANVVAVLPLDTEDEDVISRAMDLWTDAVLHEWEIVYVETDGVHVSVPEPEEPETVEQQPKPRRSRTGSDTPRKKEEPVPDSLYTEGVTQPLDSGLEDKTDTLEESVTYAADSDQGVRTPVMEDTPQMKETVIDPVPQGVDLGALPRATSNTMATTNSWVTFTKESAPAKSPSLEERRLDMLAVIVEYLTRR